ncbi:hypothetical protein YC2023_039870 [Brassica napus]
MCIDTIRLPNRSMVRWLVARDTGLPSAAPLLRSYAKVETMTMAELNAFVVNAASQDVTLHVNLISIMQEIDFLRIGRFVRLDKDKGWCYAACSKCSKKLQRTASAFTCARCNNLHAMLKTVGQDELKASSRLLSFFVDHLNNMFVTFNHSWCCQQGRHVRNRKPPALTRDLGFPLKLNILPPDPAINWRRIDSIVSSELFIFFLLIK